MLSLLQNKYIRFVLYGLAGIVLFLLVAGVLLSSLSDARNSGATSFDSVAPGFGGGMMGDMDARQEMGYAPSTQSAGRGMVYPTPTPDGGYTSNLEAYETTSYDVRGRSDDFEEACALLSQLKVNRSIDFKYLNMGLNNCSAQFFVSDATVSNVLSQLNSFEDLSVERNTVSVTRHKQQLESQTDIIDRQLAAVNAALTEAEAAYDEIIALARETRDAETLNSALRNKLEQIDYLSEKKIMLVSQLDALAQQAADLRERIDVIAFTVSISRANALQPGKYERKWEQAWEDLRDQVTDTLIGVTAFFGVYLLLLIQYGLYLLVLIVLARFGWKLVQKVWRL